MESKLAPLVDALKSKKKVCLFTGAGVSTGAGIPDFRSPDTGLYSNLAKLNLPYAEAVFDIDFFKENPKPFYTLAEELFPGNYAPTKFHYLVRILQEQNLLKRVYTQNIDILDRLAGVKDNFIIEAHGSFATSRCIHCKKEVSIKKLKVMIKEKKVPTCAHCKGYIKPDITFYGEGLPSKFFETWDKDRDDVEVALVSGTSLTVYPFASLPSSLDKTCLRVLANREKVGDLGRRKKDIVVLLDCDEFAETLADLLGWKDDLEKYYKEGQKKYGKSHAVEDELEKIDEKLKREAGVEKVDKDRSADHSEDEEGLDELINKLKI